MPELYINHLSLTGAIRVSLGIAPLLEIMKVKNRKIKLQKIRVTKVIYLMPLHKDLMESGSRSKWSY